MTTPFQRTAAEELRIIVRNINNCRETFNDRFTLDQLIKIHRAFLACGWDNYPDTWTQDQIDDALDGHAPVWDDDGLPVMRHFVPRPLGGATMSLRCACDEGCVCHETRLALQDIGSKSRIDEKVRMLIAIRDVFEGALAPDKQHSIETTAALLKVGIALQTRIGGE